MALNLQTIMVSMIDIFNKYAGKDGNASTLSQDELCDMAKKEFPALCNSDKKDEILKGVFGQMDMDGDKSVNFQEFICFVGTLTMIIKEHLK